MIPPFREFRIGMPSRREGALAGVLLFLAASSVPAGAQDANLFGRARGRYARCRDRLEAGHR